MDVLPEAARRTLAYIALVNRGGAHPSPEGVRQFYWSDSPTRRDSLSDLLSAMQRATLQMGTEEDPVSYLLRMHWVEFRGAGVALTSVGQALVRALDAAEEEHDVVEAVLDVEDPFAYARAVTYLRTDAPALLVDPYLRMPQLIELDRVPTVERVLVSSTKLTPSDLGDLGRAAEIITGKRSMEVRKVGELHDRYLIPATGSVVMLGGSLNTIGRAPITLTTLSPQLSDVVRETYEKRWTDAQTVDPPALPAEREKASDD